MDRKVILNNCFGGLSVVFALLWVSTLDDTKIIENFKNLKSAVLDKEN